MTQNQDSRKKIARKLNGLKKMYWSIFSMQMKVKFRQIILHFKESQETTVEDSRSETRNRKQRMIRSGLAKLRFEEFFFRSRIARDLASRNTGNLFWFALTFSTTFVIDWLHAFYFISNTFISNARLKFANFQNLSRKILRTEL